MTVFVFCLISLAAAVVYFVSNLGAGNVSYIWKSVIVLIVSFVAVNVLFLIAVFIISLFFKNSAPIKKQSRLCRRLVFLIGDIICTYSGVRVHITGKEKIPEQERFLFVCNHISGYDPLIFMAKMSKYNVSFISKPSNLKNPVVKNLAEAAGFLSIDRENNREALKTIITAAEYIKNGVCSIGIYPEGTRSRTGRLGDFHNGSFKIATKSQCPVVIACVKDTDKVKNNILRRRTDAYLDILDVIPAEKVKTAGTSELSNYSRGVISSHQSLFKETGESE